MESTLFISELKAFAIDKSDKIQLKKNELLKRNASYFLHGELAKKTSIGRSPVKTHFRKALKVLYDEEKKLNQNFETRNEIIIDNLSKMRDDVKFKEYDILLKYYIFMLTRASYRVRSTLVSYVFIYCKNFSYILLMFMLLNLSNNRARQQIMIKKLLFRANGTGSRSLEIQSKISRWSTHSRRHNLTMI